RHRSTTGKRRTRHLPVGAAAVSLRQPPRRHPQHPRPSHQRAARTTGARFAAPADESATDAMKAQAITASRPGATTAAAAAPPAIISPFIDTLCTGGLSLLILVPLLVAGRTDVLLLTAGVQAWVGALVNM